jgi:hypothetical protein
MDASCHQPKPYLHAGSTFPLVFTIQQAFQRRDRACQLIADLKASVVALYLMHRQGPCKAGAPALVRRLGPQHQHLPSTRRSPCRDWAQEEGFPATLGCNQTSAAVKARAALLQLLQDMRGYLQAPSIYESYAGGPLPSTGGLHNTAPATEC